MSEGITNQAFSEVGRKLSEHGLNIPIKLEDEILFAHEGSQKTKEQQEFSSRNKTSLSLLIQSFVSKYDVIVRVTLLVAINVLIIAYFGVASFYWYQNTNGHDPDWCNGYGFLALAVAFLYTGIFYKKVLKNTCHKAITSCLKPATQYLEKNFCCGAKTLLCIAIVAAIAIFIIIDTLNSRNRLMSLAGFGSILCFGWVFSKHPTRVNWRPVVWGLILQFSFGLFTIRWATGRAIFSCLAEKVVTFLNYAQVGASFVFSEKLVEEKVFAFAALPVIFFFSFVIQILYYWGVMQSIVKSIGWLLHLVMGTTVCESMNAAANTFVGMTEAPLLIKPYLSKLTGSEIHAIMCSGFATVAGTVLAAYIQFGASPAHLITASVMAAPAALSFSKLFYPETEKSETTFDNIALEKSQDSGVIDAATKGALAAIPLILGIIANIIAFVSAVAFLNAILSWLGVLVGVPGLTFEWVLAKAFMPVSWLMGVPWQECEHVGTLIGLKTVVNEFIAYQKLGQLKNDKLLSPRSEAIATYAICGFANPGSIGIMIGVLTTMCPEKREDIVNNAVRAFVAGSLICFLNASTAGVLIDDSFFETPI